MMVGLLRPTSGRVLFNGTETSSVQKRRIGVCPQDLVLTYGSGLSLDVILQMTWLIVLTAIWFVVGVAT
jgi:ABC-type Mn2+/Zn2+ transport system ATPase subunit